MSAERFFDGLARTLAEPMPRRRAVRVIGASLVAIAVPGVSPRMALGASACDNGCGADVRACPRIVNLGTAPPKCCGSSPARRYICEGTPADPTCKDTCKTGIPCKSKRKDEAGCSYFDCCTPPEFCPDGECVPNCRLLHPGAGRKQCGAQCCPPGQECVTWSSSSPGTPVKKSCVRPCKRGERRCPSQKGAGIWGACCSKRCCDFKCCGDTEECVRVLQSDKNKNQSDVKLCLEKCKAPETRCNLGCCTKANKAYRKLPDGRLRCFCTG